MCVPPMSTAMIVPMILIIPSLRRRRQGRARKKRRLRPYYNALYVSPVGHPSSTYHPAGHIHCHCCAVLSFCGYGSAPSRCRLPTRGLQQRGPLLPLRGAEAALEIGSLGTGSAREHPCGRSRSSSLDLRIAEPAGDPFSGALGGIRSAGRDCWSPRRGATNMDGG